MPHRKVCNASVKLNQFKLLCFICQEQDFMFVYAVFFTIILFLGSLKNHIDFPATVCHILVLWAVTAPMLLALFPFHFC